MISEVFWTNKKFPGRIALVARPRGGDWLEDEAAAWSAAGIDAIVSMLEQHETAAFELENEAEFCRMNGIEFFSFPVTDRSVPPDDEAFLKFAVKLKNLLARGKNLGIHCRQSVGRAPLLAAAVMTLFGIAPDEAFRLISDARGVEVPETEEQREWLGNFARKFAPVLN